MERDGVAGFERLAFKCSKARNLLERLRDFEQDVLRFMDVAIVPFTNNRGRMTCT